MEGMYLKVEVMLYARDKYGGRISETRLGIEEPVPPSTSPILHLRSSLNDIARAFEEVG